MAKIIRNVKRNQVLRIEWSNKEMVDLKTQESVKVPAGENLEKNHYVQSYLEAGWLTIEETVKASSGKSSTKLKSGGDE